MSDKVSTENYLQVRRPNKLFDKPLKKNIALLFDVLALNFYVTNPDRTGFDMSWMELESIYGINTRNKKHIKLKLSELQDLNYISDLKMWNNGFSYKFEKTFLSLEELLKPKTWTFLNFNVMQQLDSISYQLYTLAYKFYNFTDASKRNMEFKNQTKLLKVPDFLELFHFSKTNMNYSKNRLLYLIKQAVKNLDTNFGIKIDIFIKKFGRPIVGVKFKFMKVPKLKRILSKFLDLTVVKVKNNYKKAKDIFQTKENWNCISATKKSIETKEILEVARKHTMRTFIIKEVFSNILDSRLPALNKTRAWIMDNYISKEQNLILSLDEAASIFNRYKKRGTFKHLMEIKIIKKENLDTMRISGRLQYWINGSHPLMPSVKGDVLVLAE